MKKKKLKNHRPVAVHIIPLNGLFENSLQYLLFAEEKQSPRARALDTVLVLDTSDSVVRDHLDELKTVVHTFIDCEFLLIPYFLQSQLE